MGRMCASAAADHHAACVERRTGQVRPVRIATAKPAVGGPACAAMGTDAGDAIAATCRRSAEDAQGLSDPNGACAAIGDLSQKALAAVCSGIEKQAK
jgi:hypothetical protein